MSSSSWTYLLDSVSNLDLDVTKPSSRYIASIMHECINQIQMVNRRIYQHVDLNQLKYKTPQQRYKKPHHYKLVEDTEVEFGTLDESVKKMYAISDLFCTLLHTIKTEMVVSGEHTILQKLLVDFADTKEDDKYLIDNREMKNYENLNRQIKIYDAKIKQVNDEKLPLSESLIKQYERVMFEMDLKTTYIKHWEDASNEQLLIQNEKKTNELKKIIYETEQKIEDELSSSNSILSYLWINISDMQKEIELWQKKYELDYNNKHNQILYTYSKKEEMKEIIATMREDYKIKENKIKEMLICREKRKEKLKKENKQEKEERKISIQSHRQNSKQKSKSRSIKMKSSIKIKTRNKA